MLEYLYIVFIAPLELLIRVTLEWGFSHTASYGLSIILMSLVANILLLPLYHLAETWQEAERSIQSAMAGQVALIKAAFHGREKYYMLRTLYRQHHYHPIMAVRTSFGFLIQVPFFFAAYHLLSNYAPLHGTAFWIFSDLSLPDGLLSVGNYNINILPFAMTFINVISAFVYTSRMSKKDKVQLYVVAAIFLVLLYDSASGIVFYWTCNNVFSFIKNIFYVRFSLYDKFDINTYLEKLYISLRKAFSTTGGTVVLLALIPLLVMWNANYYILEIDIFFVNLMILALALFFVYKFINVFADRRVFLGIVCLLVTSYCFLAFYSVLSLWPDARIQKIILLGLCSVLLYLFVCYCRGALNKILICIVIFLMPLLIGRISSNYLATDDGAGTSELNFNYPLKNKPNIYLYALESYNSFEIMKKFYNIDSSDIIEYLNSNGFHIYDNIYSSGRSTLISLYRLFSMSTTGRTVGNEHVRNYVFECLNGGVGNNLFKYLKNNGYYIYHYLEMSPNLSFKGKYVDYYSAPVSGIYAKLFSQYVFNKKMYSIVNYILNHIDHRVKYDTFDDFRRNFFVHQRNIPHFVVLFGGADHTPSDGTYTYVDRKKWIDSGVYQRWVQESNQEIRDICDKICSVDKNSIIILIGDHGSWLLRGIWDKCKSVEELNNALKAEGLTMKDFVDDVLGITLAIRIGGDYVDISNGHKITPANLFRHIFAYLNNAPEQLANTIVETETDLDQFILVKNGTISPSLR